APLSPDQHAQLRELDNVHLCESNYKLEWMENPWSDLEHASRWLLELESRYAPAIVHLNGYVHAVLPWRAPVLVVGHSCVLSWWRAVKGTEAPSCWDKYAERVARGLNSAHAVVTPSAAMLNDLNTYYGPLRNA